MGWRNWLLIAIDAVVLFVFIQFLAGQIGEPYLFGYTLVGLALFMVVLWLIASRPNVRK